MKRSSDAITPEGNLDTTRDIPSHKEARTMRTNGNGLPTWDWLPPEVIRSTLVTSKILKSFEISIIPEYDFVINSHYDGYAWVLRVSKVDKVWTSKSGGVYVFDDAYYTTRPLKSPCQIRNDMVAKTRVLSAVQILATMAFYCHRTGVSPFMLPLSSESYTVGGHYIDSKMEPLEESDIASSLSSDHVKSSSSLSPNSSLLSDD